ncbi:MAG TPA: ROK family protein [Clostridia bacterium]
MTKKSRAIASKHDSMRQKNERLILELFCKGDFSTFQVSKQLGLSSGGAKKLVDDIALGNIIARAPSQRQGNLGRMPITYGLNPKYCKIAIINFADNTISLIDLSGKVKDKIDLNIPPTIRDEHIYQTASELKAMLERDEDKDIPLAAISIAYLGKLHGDTYDNYFSGAFERCTINLYKYFSQEFGVEVLLRNDLHFAILAERQYGVLTGAETSCCYMQIGRGCACSFLINDKLYVGSSGLAGEIGHNLSMESGKILEHYVDWYSARNAISEKIAAGEPTCLSGKFTRQEAIEAYKNNDTLVCSVIDQMAKNAGIMLKNLTELMDFDVIILSGLMLEFGDRYYNTLMEKFLSYGYKHVKIVQSTLGENAIFLGAFEAARDIVFTRFIESRLRK